MRGPRTPAPETLPAFEDRNDAIVGINVDQIAVVKDFRGVGDSNDTGNAKFTADDRDMRGKAPYLRNNGSGPTKNRYEIRTGVGDNQNVPVG